MRIFLDTNIFPEFIERRTQYESVCKLLISINIGDFKRADQRQIEILTPTAFADKYIDV